jgi:nicotinate-nucleotide adenylyltransferase
MSSAGRARFGRSHRPEPRLAPRRVGLLGGSFNPAHAGHLDISRTALRKLGLDEVWWLVSPQNPLKSVSGMAPLAERLRSARALAKHPRIRVTSLEDELRTQYTADTLVALRRRFPHTRFVWLMGADNLADISRWERWSQIFRTMPVAVLARPSYSVRALAMKAARRFGKFRLPERSARRLAEHRPPAWVFVSGRLNPLSATAIRRARVNGRR